jgi:hypothetical protein
MRLRLASRSVGFAPLLYPTTLKNAWRGPRLRGAVALTEKLDSSSQPSRPSRLLGRRSTGVPVQFAAMARKAGADGHRIILDSLL